MPSRTPTIADCLVFRPAANLRGHVRVLRANAANVQKHQYRNNQHQHHQRRKMNLKPAALHPLPARHSLTEDEVSAQSHDDDAHRNDKQACQRFAIRFVQSFRDKSARHHRYCGGYQDEKGSIHACQRTQPWFESTGKCLADS
jgi:hypothetical protein